MRQLVLAALLSLAAHPVLASAVACTADGSDYVVHEVIASADVFRLQVRSASSAPRAHGPDIEGEYSQTSPLYTSAAPDTAVVSTFRSRDGQPSAIVWLADGNYVTLPGRVVAAVVPDAGRVAAVVRIVPRGRDDAARDVVIARDGSIAAARSLAWHSEEGSNLAMSVDQTRVYDRPSALGGNLRRIELREIDSLDVASTFSLGDTIIEDVVVVGARLSFFTAGGNVFTFKDRAISSIRESDPKLRHSALDVDPRHQRVLVYGVGGYRVFAYDGMELFASVHGRPLVGVIGFTRDGLVLHDAVSGEHRIRTLDALSGAVVSELVGAPSPWATGQRIFCAHADRLVTVHDNGAGAVAEIPLTPASER